MINLALPAYADSEKEQNVRPGINRHYENPNFTQWVMRFERPGREVFDKRHMIVAATEIKPGMVIADIGAGTGLFTRLFSPRVAPGGKVIAVDTSKIFIENILKRSRNQGLMNVEGIINTPKDTLLSEKSVDLAFVCDTYHHFEYPQSTLNSIYRALRPNGILQVIDFRKVPGLTSPWVMNHVRAGKQTVIKEIEAAGFKLIEEKEFLRTNYFLRFKKV